jgi:hypothetical protein
VAADVFLIHSETIEACAAPLLVSTTSAATVAGLSERGLMRLARPIHPTFDPTWLPEARSQHAAGIENCDCPRGVLCVWTVGRDVCRRSLHMSASFRIKSAIVTPSPRTEAQRRGRGLSRQGPGWMITPRKSRWPWRFAQCVRRGQNRQRIAAIAPAVLKPGDTGPQHHYSLRLRLRRCEKSRGAASVD